MGCEMREERPFPSSCARPQGAFYFSIIASFWGGYPAETSAKESVPKGEAIWCSQKLYNFREYFIT